MNAKVDRFDRLVAALLTGIIGILFWPMTVGWAFPPLMEPIFIPPVLFISGFIGWHNARRIKAWLFEDSQ